MPQRFKSSIKRLAAALLYYAGVMGLWRSVVLRRKAVVLMYHRVLTDDESRRTGSHPGIVVDRDTFELHMRVLARHFRVMSLEEFSRCLENRLPFPDSACLVTFDDGWLDNYAHGWPVLKRHDFPSVIFLPVNFIGTSRLFWREALTHVLAQGVIHLRQGAEADGTRFVELLEASGLSDLLEIADPVSAPAVAAVAAGKQLTEVSARRLMSDVSAWMGVGLDEIATPDRFMDWRQVMTMADDGVTFGGHGADHLRLSEASEEEAQAEIVTSLQVIRQKFSGSVPAFAYPNGSWNGDIADRVKASGYRLAFTTDPGFVSCDDDRFTIRRMNIHEDATGSAPLFLARVLGLM